MEERDSEGGFVLVPTMCRPASVHALRVDRCLGSSFDHACRERLLACPDELRTTTLAWCELASAKDKETHARNGVRVHTLFMRIMHGPPIAN